MIVSLASSVDFAVPEGLVAFVVSMVVSEVAHAVWHVQSGLPCGRQDRLYRWLVRMITGVRGDHRSDREPGS